MEDVHGLPAPSFYRSANAEDFLYAPDQQQLFEDALRFRETHRIRPASEDRRNVHLLLVDGQRDFCFKQGALFVAGRSGRGALDDNRRTAEFIYRNLDRITNITATLDTHLAFQIFFASFWVDREGRTLTPYREITSRDLEVGSVRPNPRVADFLGRGSAPWLLEYTRFYTSELERQGKYRLYLWPPHCILGSMGHTMVGVLHEAQLFHAYARDVQAWATLKGNDPLTENYSVLWPEVRQNHEGHPLTAPGSDLLERLLRADVILVAGQAASHCVKNTLEDLLVELRARDPALVTRIYVLTDCMSAVAIPDGQGGFLADFTPQAEAAMARFAAAGMHLVRSTAPMHTWPGLASLGQQ